MPAKSIKSLNKAKLDRPFDARTLREAEKIARGYRIIIEYTDGEYYGSALELPNVMADGKTRAACLRATQEAITVAVATMLEHGQEPPNPSIADRRSEQINVRLTPLEKLRLEEASRQLGYRGLSDFIRAKALES